ncbi:tetratricopeptide repeat protein [Methylobacterium gossipiicola]|uniref:Tetratricopeptide repeat-containing protein n=1 Tax=Methylobacterium gossipiicola TaxID=582675 RepID=A0A1I2SMX6_9HYPH|nr:tetratricopeptide repeat protein [Methylobacterium gossipiicola]SFG54148.1 Tetratricopeptide repeat-containing protein [Methylobacterium gossipiicola]
MNGNAKTSRIGRRTLSALALCLAATVSVQAAQPRESTPLPEFEPAESLEGNFLAAYIAGASKDTAAAASFYREAVKADPRNTELLERAFVSLLADGALPDAFRAAERLTSRDGTNGLAQLALGVRQIKAGQFAQARQNFARSGRGAAADLTATLLTAWAFAGAGDGKRAQETINKLKGERNYSTFRDYHAGLIAAVTGDQAEAERRLKAAYDGDHNTLRVVDAYARFEAQAGRTDLAIQAYSDFDKLLPRHPIVRDALNRLKEGKPLPRLVTTAQEGAGEVLYGLGSAGSTQGDELPAVVYLRLALYLAPEHALARLTLADILDRMKQPERANETYAQIPANSPLRLNADVQIGLNLEQMGKGEEAIQHLDAAMKAHPNDIDVITALGNVQRSRKKYEEAAETYSRAISLIGDQPASNFWTTFYFRGTAYERAKQWVKAEADLKKALELVPPSQPAARAQVLNYLAYSWVDQNINIDEAFTMLKQAVDASPRDGMIIDSLGWAYFRLGRWDEAMRELEKAIELKPGDPTINDHLGDAYWRAGRRLEGKFQWQHAKDLNPDPEELEKINAKLKDGLPELDKPAATAENPPAEKVNPELPKGAPAPSEPPGAADKKSGG